MINWVDNVNIISRCKEYQSWRFELWQRPNARNVSFETLYSGQFTLSTQLIILNYPNRYLSLCSKISLETHSEPIPCFFRKAEFTPYLQAVLDFPQNTINKKPCLNCSYILGYLVSCKDLMILTFTIKWPFKTISCYLSILPFNSHELRGEMEKLNYFLSSYWLDHLMAYLFTLLCLTVNPNETSYLCSWNFLYLTKGRLIK